MGPNSVDGLEVFIGQVSLSGDFLGSFDGCNCDSFLGDIGILVDDLQFEVDLVGIGPSGFSGFHNFMAQVYAETSNEKLGLEVLAVVFRGCIPATLGSVIIVDLGSHAVGVTVY